jgi:hypothetical protein
MTSEAIAVCFENLDAMGVVPNGRYVMLAGPNTGEAFHPPRPGGDRCARRCLRCGLRGAAGRAGRVTARRGRGARRRRARSAGW